MWKNVLKIVSVVTVVVFTATTVVWSAPEPVYAIKIREAQGIVKQRYKGSAIKTIIHIQDAHASLEAQRNISRIIQELVTSGVTNLVGVEGAVGQIDMDDFRRYPISGVRAQVADAYMQQAKFTGSEHAKISVAEDFQLVGLEDKELFQQNLKSYYQASLQSATLRASMDEIEAALSVLKGAVFGDALQSFDAVASQYEHEEIDLFSYVAVLYDHLARAGLDLYEYMHLSEFQKTLALKSRLDDARVSEEERMLCERLAEQGETIDVSDASEYERAVYLKHAAMRAGISLRAYPQVSLACEYVQLYAMLDFQRLLAEVEKATYAVRMRLAKNEDARALIQWWQRAQIFRHVLMLKAARNEACYFQKKRDVFRFERVHRFIRTMAQKHAVSVSLSACSHNTVAAEAVVESFYRDAARRDEALVNNLLTQMDRCGEQTAVLLSGGFHSAGVLQRLKHAGINYLNVVPTISTLVSDIPYEQKMTGKVIPFAPEMTSYIHALFSSGVASGLIDAVAFEQLKHDYELDAKLETVFVALAEHDIEAVIAPLQNDAEYAADVDLIKTLAAQFAGKETVTAEDTAAARELIDSYPRVLESLQRCMDVLRDSTAAHTHEAVEEAASRTARVSTPQEVVDEQAETGVEERQVQVKKITDTGVRAPSFIRRLFKSVFFKVFVALVVAFLFIADGLSAQRDFSDYDLPVLEKAQWSEFVTDARSDSTILKSEGFEPKYIGREEFLSLIDGNELCLVEQDGFGLTRPGENRTPLLYTEYVCDCVAMILFDPVTHTGLLTHVSVYSQRYGVRGETHDLDGLLPKLLDEMVARGVDKKNIEAGIVGGYNFEFMPQSKYNYGKIQGFLESENIPITLVDVGSDKFIQRNVLFDTRASSVNEGYYLEVSSSDDVDALALLSLPKDNMRRKVFEWGGDVRADSEEIFEEEKAYFLRDDNLSRPENRGLKSRNVRVSNFMGKLYDASGALVTSGVRAEAADGQYIFKDAKGNRLYTKGAQHAAVATLDSATAERSLLSGIIASDVLRTQHPQFVKWIDAFERGNGRVKVIKDNPDIQGFFDRDRNVLYVTETLAADPVAFLHELGEGYFALAEGAGELPQGVPAHTYLRGVGKDVRDAMGAIAAREGDGVDAWNASHIVRALEAELADRGARTLSDAERALISHNDQQGLRGLSLLYGIQDAVFGVARNERLTAQMQERVTEVRRSQRFRRYMKLFVAFVSSLLLFASCIAYMYSGHSEPTPEELQAARVVDVVEGLYQEYDTLDYVNTLSLHNTILEGDTFLVSAYFPLMKDSRFSEMDWYSVTTVMHDLMNSLFAVGVDGYFDYFPDFLRELPVAHQKYLLGILSDRVTDYDDNALVLFQKIIAPESFETLSPEIQLWVSLIVEAINNHEFSPDVGVYPHVTAFLQQVDKTDLYRALYETQDISDDAGGDVLGVTQVYYYDHLNALFVGGGYRDLSAEDLTVFMRESMEYATGRVDWAEVLPEMLSLLPISKATNDVVRFYSREYSAHLNFMHDEYETRGWERVVDGMIAKLNPTQLYMLMAHGSRISYSALYKKIYPAFLKEMVAQGGLVDFVEDIDPTQQWYADLLVSLAAHNKLGEVLRRSGDDAQGVGEMWRTINTRLMGMLHGYAEQVDAASDYWAVSKVAVEMAFLGKAFATTFSLDESDDVSRSVKQDLIDKLTAVVQSTASDNVFRFAALLAQQYPDAFAGLKSTLDQHKQQLYDEVLKITEFSEQPDYASLIQTDENGNQILPVFTHFNESSQTHIAPLIAQLTAAGYTQRAVSDEFSERGIQYVFSGMTDNGISIEFRIGVAMEREAYAAMLRDGGALFSRGHGGEITEDFAAFLSRMDSEGVAVGVQTTGTVATGYGAKGNRFIEWFKQIAEARGTGKTHTELFDGTVAAIGVDENYMIGPAHMQNKIIMAMTYDADYRDSKYDRSISVLHLDNGCVGALRSPGMLAGEIARGGRNYILHEKNLSVLQSTNFIGKLFTRTGRLVTEGIAAVADAMSRSVIFMDEDLQPLYTKDGSTALVQIVDGTVDASVLFDEAMVTALGHAHSGFADVVRTVSERGLSVRILEESESIRGFYDTGSDVLYVSRELLNNPVALFHELGEGYFAGADGKRELPRGVNAHTYLRGVGKEVRHALAAVRARHGAVIDQWDAQTLVPALSEALQAAGSRQLTDIERSLIAHNVRMNVRGEALLYGLQDRVFSARDNERFTAQMAVTGKLILYVNDGMYSILPSAQMTDGIAAILDRADISSKENLREYAAARMGLPVQDVIIRSAGEVKDLSKEEYENNTVAVFDLLQFDAAEGNNIATVRAQYQEVAERVSGVAGATFKTAFSERTDYARERYQQPVMYMFDALFGFPVGVRPAYAGAALSEGELAEALRLDVGSEARTKMHAALRDVSKLKVLQVSA